MLSKLLWDKFNRDKLKWFLNTKFYNFTILFTCKLNCFRLGMCANELASIVEISFCCKCNTFSLIKPKKAHFKKIKPKKAEKDSLGSFRSKLISPKKAHSSFSVKYKSSSLFSLLKVPVLISLNLI